MITTFWPFTEVNHTDGAKKELKELFQEKIPFDTPKPIDLVKRINEISSDKSSLILDFFAGSGTTLHATMALNAEDGGCRQCILVTNNENNICEEVTYERNRRVIQGYTTPKGVQVEGLGENNLRYYRSRLLPRERTHHNRQQLVNACTDLLCIKEGLYGEERQFGERRFRPTVARYFREGERRMLVVYNDAAIPLVAEQVAHCGATERHRLKIYTFSDGPYPYTDEFVAVLPLVELCALPEAIYQAYAAVLPKRRDVQEEGGEG